MHARVWIMGGLLAVAAVSAAAPKGDPKPTAIDPKPLQGKLQVFQDGAGGTYVVHEPRTSDYRIWYGTGKELYEQITRGRSADGDAWSLAIWAPRIPEIRPGSVERRKDGTFRKTCDGRDDAVLTELTGDKARAVLAKHKLMTEALVRRPHMLARDDRGVYYYVDKLSKQLGGKGFRVFVGKKGAMKQLPLVDVASDRGGEVFSTKRGDLRLVVSEEGSRERLASWLRGERKTELLSLDLHLNSPVIFTDLGIYKFLGTICDNV